MSQHDGRISSTWGKMPTFENTRRVQISIADLKAILTLCLKLLEKDPEATSHIKVGEESSEIPRSIDATLEIVRTLGGESEVEYVSVFATNWILSADFFKGTLSLAARDMNVLQSLIDQWTTTVSEIKASPDAKRLAAKIESRRFITACIQPDGLIGDYPGGAVALDRAYTLVLLRSISYASSLRFLAQLLLTKQNRDGGWGRQLERESDPKSTASSIFLIRSLPIYATRRTRKRGAKYLARVQKPTGEWDGALDLRSMLLCTAGLYYGDPSQRRSLQSAIEKIRSFMDDFQNIMSVDYVLFEAMKDFSKTVYEMLLKRYVTALREIPTRRIMNVTVASSVIMLARDLALHADTSLFKECVSYLEASFSREGGWTLPQEEHPTLSATLMGLIALESSSKHPLREHRKGSP